MTLVSTKFGNGWYSRQRVICERGRTSMWTAVVVAERKRKIVGAWAGISAIAPASRSDRSPTSASAPRRWNDLGHGARKITRSTRLGDPVSSDRPSHPPFDKLADRKTDLQFFTATHLDSRGSSLPHPSLRSTTTTIRRIRSQRDRVPGDTAGSGPIRGRRRYPVRPQDPSQLANWSETHFDVLSFCPTGAFARDRARKGWLRRFKQSAA